MKIAWHHADGRLIRKSGFSLWRGAYAERRVLLSLLFMSACLFFSCSFDYGDAVVDDNDQPDVVMNDVEYVRVQNGDPLVRVTADTVERYEERQIMNLKEFTFEQFQQHGTEVNVEGRAGTARAEIDTGNVQLANGIRIDVKSEDISITTEHLYWEDEARRIVTERDDEVSISRSDGTSFTGIGFSVDARNRTFMFEKGISGLYVDEDKAEAAVVAEIKKIEGPKDVVASEAKLQAVIEAGAEAEKTKAPNTVNSEAEAKAQLETVIEAVAEDQAAERGIYE